MVLRKHALPSFFQAQVNLTRSDTRDKPDHLDIGAARSTPRPATVSVNEEIKRSKPPLFQRKHGPSRRHHHHQHFYHPRHRIPRNDRIIKLIPFLSPPSPPEVRRPSSRHPSRNLSQDDYKNQGMGSTISTLPGEEIRGGSEVKRPTTPLTHTTGTGSFTATRPPFYQPLSEAFPVRGTVSSNGLTFRKRVSRVQLKNSLTNTNARENKHVSSERFTYNGPNQTYDGPISSSNVYADYDRPLYTLIPPADDEPGPFNWNNSPFAPNKNQNKNTKDSIEESRGIISFTSPRRQPTPSPPVPVEVYKNVKTLFLPYPKHPLSVHASNSLHNLLNPFGPTPPSPKAYPQGIQHHSQSAPIMYFSYPVDTATGSGIVHTKNDQTQHSSSLNPSQLLHVDPSGVPNDIQDDLMRIEMLLELRRYKRALTTQRQAQQRLMQICGNGSCQNLRNPNAPNHIQNNTQVSQSLRNLLLGQQQQQRRTKAELQKYLMDVFKILSNSLNLEDIINPGSAGNGNQSQTPAAQETTSSPSPSQLPPQQNNEEKDPSKTFWETELEKHLRSDLLTTYMGPHSLAPESVGGSHSHTDEQTPRSVSLLRGAMNTGDFDTNERSRSGFPSGMAIPGVTSSSNPNNHQSFPPNENPLLAGARLSPMYQAQAANQGNFQNGAPQFTSTPPPPAPPLQRQYQQYHALNNTAEFSEVLKTLSPQAIKILENTLSGGASPTILPPPAQVELNPHPHDPHGQSIPENVNMSVMGGQGGQQEGGSSIIEMLRKPVQVRSPNSPLNAYTPVPSTTPSQQQPESRELPEEKPSPFFPGFTGKIDMKIRTPEEKGIGQAQQQQQPQPQPQPQPLGKKIASFGDGDLPLPGEGILTPPINNPILKRSNPTGGDVEELGNLLSQLPVLSRKQKVEEFAFKTLKPASPVGEAESETSMIPLVSSQGTVLTGTGTSRVPSSSGRPDTTDGMQTETEDELRNLDTTKMSISELVMLGRKIYRILSQLNTSSPKKETQVIANPVTLDLPPNVPLSFPSNFINNNEKVVKGKSKSQTNSAAAVVIDFNSIPNPTFVAGPGIVQTKSQPKVLNNNNSLKRTPTVKTPNLFKKIVHPPPTRWGRAASVNPNQNQSQQHTRRSVSSIHSSRPGSRSGQNIKIAVEETRFLGGAKPQGPNFPVMNRFSNNHRGDLMREPVQKTSGYKRRMETPHSQVDTQASTTTNATWGRTKSGSRRNFILENITRVKNMKKKPESKVRPKPLPPVRRKYEYVQSTIRSRSRSRDGTMSAGRRSSSVPATPGATQSGYYGRRTGTASVPGTAQSSRPSTGSITSRSRSPSMGRNTTITGVRSTKTRIIPREETMVPVGGNGSNNRRFISSPSYTKRVYGKPPGSRETAESARVIMRKSRSKTKRGGFGSRPESVRSSSASSLDHSSLGGQRRSRSRPTSADKSRTRKNYRSGSRGEAKEEEMRLIGELINTDSEQKLIRNMVKVEMEEIMKNKLQELLKKSKEEEEEAKKQKTQQHQHQQRSPAVASQKLTTKLKNLKSHELDSDESSTVIASENLTPLYTPPKVHDESLFSLEKWINPDGTAYTNSTKETPLTTADGMSLGAGTGHHTSNLAGRRQNNKSQSVRFSLPHGAAPAK